MTQASWYLEDCSSQWGPKLLMNGRICEWFQNVLTKTVPIQIVSWIWSVIRHISFECGDAAVFDHICI